MALFQVTADDPEVSRGPGRLQAVLVLLISPWRQSQEVHFLENKPTSQLAAPDCTWPSHQVNFCISSALTAVFPTCLLVYRVQCPFVQPPLSCRSSSLDLEMTFVPHAAGPPRMAGHSVTAGDAGFLPAPARASRPPVGMELFGVCFSYPKSLGMGNCYLKWHLHGEGLTQISPSPPPPVTPHLPREAR